MEYEKQLEERVDSLQDKLCEIEHLYETLKSKLVLFTTCTIHKDRLLKIDLGLVITKLNTSYDSTGTRELITIATLNRDRNVWRVHFDSRFTGAKDVPININPCKIDECICTFATAVGFDVKDLTISYQSLDIPLYSHT